VKPPFSAPGHLPRYLGNHWTVYKETCIIQKKSLWRSEWYEV